MLPSLLFTPGSMILISILNPFSLPIIAINLFLLFVVFNMRKLYLGNSNKQFKPVPIKIKNHTSFIILTLLGYALILIPVGFLGLLFYADFSTETYAEFIEVFYRLVPNIFELYGNEINLILCVLCFAVSIICQSAKSIAIRIWNIILLILSISLSAFVFSPCDAEALILTCSRLAFLAESFALNSRR